MNATHRFSNRAEDYIKYRPGYPADVLVLLEDDLGLCPTWIIADIGSGTGILTEMFLRKGNRVFAVEPNREMQAVAERFLDCCPGFHSVDGSAEATTLTSACVDLIAAAQAFHWFNVAAARVEFVRILRPGGYVLLVWNDRKTDSTPFLAAYEELLRCWSLDYEEVNHRNIDEAQLARFFGSGGFRQAVFPNVQRFDWEGLRGRARSSSYVPAPGHPRHEPFMKGLRQAFDKFHGGGQVTFEYDTRAYYGPLSP